LRPSRSGGSPAPCPPCPPRPSPAATPATRLRRQPDARLRPRSTTQAWTDAKARFDASVKHQGELTTQLQATDAQLASLQEQVGSIALAAYRTGPLTTFAALMDATSRTASPSGPGPSTRSPTTTTTCCTRYSELQKTQAAQKKALETEVATQQQQVQTMEQQKKDAEKALSLAGGPSKGFVTANLPVADPVARNATARCPRSRAASTTPRPPAASRPA
jgi:hypothetical protein